MRRCGCSAAAPGQCPRPPKPANRSPASSAAGGQGVAPPPGKCGRTRRRTSQCHPPGRRSGKPGIGPPTGGKTRQCARRRSRGRPRLWHCRRIPAAATSWRCLARRGTCRPSPQRQSARRPGNRFGCPCRAGYRPRRGKRVFRADWYFLAETSALLHWPSPLAGRPAATGHAEDTLLSCIIIRQPMRRYNMRFNRLGGGVSPGVGSGGGMIEGGQAPACPTIGTVGNSEL